MRSAGLPPWAFPAGATFLGLALVLWRGWGSVSQWIERRGGRPAATAPQPAPASSPGPGAPLVEIAPGWRDAGSLRLESANPRGFLNAQLVPGGGEELVVMSPASDSQATIFDVYSWRNGAFQHVLGTQTLLNFQDPAVGDLNGDGVAEIFALDPENRPVVIQERSGILDVGIEEPLTDRMVAALGISGFRGGKAELLLAVDSRQRSDSPGEPRYDRIYGYRPMGPRWIKTWEQSVSQRGASLRLLSGDYLSTGGSELLLIHMPGDVRPSVIEAWNWSGGLMTRAAETDSSDAGPRNVLSWEGVTDGLPTGPRTILANAGSASGGGLQGRLLRWETSGVRALRDLPGELLAAGDFRGEGQTGLLIRSVDGGYRMIEASGGYKRAGSGRCPGFRRSGVQALGRSRRGGGEKMAQRTAARLGSERPGPRRPPPGL